MADEVHVVITHPVGDYERGAIITDSKVAAAMLADHPSKCVAIVPVKQAK